MTDGQVLYLAFVAFYLFECLRWVPARCWIFYARGTQPSWSHAKPWNLLRTRGGAVALLNPFPSFVMHTRAATWPCVPHEQGLCVWDDEVSFAQHLPWGSLTVRAEDAVIHFTEKLHVRCLHANEAKDWVDLICVWKTQSDKERRQSFLKLARTLFDDKNLIKATRSLRAKVRVHRLLSQGIFWGCFLLMPFAYWRFATNPPTFVVIGWIYLLMFAQAFFLWRRIRQDSVLRTGAWPRMLSTAFFPPASIRITDWLSEMKLPGIHPLALLHREDESELFHREAAKLWRESRWPIGNFPYRPWDGPEVEALAAFFKSTGLKVQDLETHPPVPATTPYCPRCLSTYTESTSECSDCIGISLTRPSPPI